MGSLSDYFNSSGSGYSIHRTALRRERLPVCCRGNLNGCGLGIVFLGLSGEEIILPLNECCVCGRYYAVCGKKYMPVDNLLKYRTINMSE